MDLEDMGGNLWAPVDGILPDKMERRGKAQKPNGESWLAWRPMAEGVPSKSSGWRKRQIFWWFCNAWCRIRFNPTDKLQLKIQFANIESQMAGASAKICRAQTETWQTAKLGTKYASLFCNYVSYSYPLFCVVGMKSFVQFILKTHTLHLVDFLMINFIIKSLAILSLM